MCAGSLHDRSCDPASSILNMSPPDKLKTDLPADPISCLSPNIAGDHAIIRRSETELGAPGRRYSGNKIAVLKLAGR